MGLDDEAEMFGASTTTTASAESLTFDRLNAMCEAWGAKRFDPLSSFPLHIRPELDEPETYTVRYPAHPFICWLAKFIRIDPWVEATYYRPRKTAYLYGNHLIVGPRMATALYANVCA